MTPARRAKLEAAIALIRDVNDADAWGTLTAETRAGLIGLGAVFFDGPANTMRHAGITASCTFDNGEHLLLRWAANARTALAEGTDTNATDEEE